MTTPENGTCTHGPMCLWCKPVGPTPENGRSPIPVDRIAIDGDRAWWVGPNSNLDDEWDASRFRQLKRPCDLCRDRFNGQSGYVVVPTMESLPCSKCHGTGRHTFYIETECSLPMCVNGEPGYWSDGDKCGYCNATCIITLTVSVVPGMVVPVTAPTADWDSLKPEITIDAAGEATLWTNSHSPHAGFNHERLDLFPSAVEPGMWAVKLTIH